VEEVLRVASSAADARVTSHRVQELLGSVAPSLPTNSVDHPSTNSEDPTPQTVLDLPGDLFQKVVQEGFRFSPRDIVIPVERMEYHLRRGGKCTPVLISTVGNLLLGGMSIAGICGMVGITYHLWMEWMENGQDPDKQPYCTFRRMVLLCRGRVEQRMVSTWVDAAEKDWRAAKEFLQVRYPGEYSGTQRVEVTGTQQVTHQHTMQVGDLQQVARILQEVGAMPSSDDIIDASIIEDQNDESNDEGPAQPAGEGS
jgi:hypothetical protein